jgi:AcrR family transcriptional regulator
MDTHPHSAGMTEIPDAPLFDALFRVAATHGWRGLTMRRVAEAASVPLETLRLRFATPVDLLLAAGRAVDAEVIAGTIPGQGSARDRLFDVLMRRFDVLQRHREGVKRLVEEVPRDPLAAFALGTALLASMAWMLEAAEIDTRGAQGIARVNGTVGVWTAAYRAWAKDDSQDLGPTMAALDKAMDQAERIARTLRLPDGDLAAPAPAEEGMTPT